ncbi:hypothetical protein POM88_015450 [Heracleum sosnowskyi]|uniref:Uncharacterized protein n=1 Tax=Heracleum sosnowskyi TaxID=360622 RepID=A0AAD8MWE6_9APIA|nr:hypothetical protein POM88_015450 [Heracleum sosnowskyi]
MEILKALKLVSPNLYKDNKIRLFTYWLHSIKAGLVVSNVVPVACSAAVDGGIRSVCVTNFRYGVNVGFISCFYASKIYKYMDNHLSCVIGDGENSDATLRP